RSIGVLVRQLIDQHAVRVVLDGRGALHLDALIRAGSIEDHHGRPRVPVQVGDLAAALGQREQEVISVALYPDHRRMRLAVRFERRQYSEVLAIKQKAYLVSEPRHRLLLPCPQKRVTNGIVADDAPGLQPIRLTTWPERIKRPGEGGGRHRDRLARRERLPALVAKRSATITR